MAQPSKKKKRESTYSLPTRILAVALTILIASGIVTYLILFLISLFGR